MQKKSSLSSGDAALRRRAEARLSEKKRTAADWPTKEADRQRLLHELQVHQIELELQNEELRQARAQLETLLTKYTALYDFSPTGYFTLDREGAIRGLNLAGARLLGIERSQLVNRQFGLFVAAETRPAFATFLRKAFAGETKEVCEAPLQQTGQPRRWVWIEACQATGGQECLLAVMDITERKQAETDRARLEQQIHAASEREQRRIGNTLHEDHCQRLAGIDALITMMAEALKAKGWSESGQAARIANEVHEALHQALQFAYMLQPVSVLEQGLLAALDHLARHVQERPGVCCHFTGESLPEIPIADATHLYRIAQEALNNAVQHAKPSRIDLGLSQSDRVLILTIADNGSGMAKPYEQASGLGLPIMRYRSDMVGAALTIESKPGAGTVVTCCYPLAGTDEGTRQAARQKMKRPSTQRLPHKGLAQGQETAP
jgi:PAS domain S-box-containing protein